MERTKNTIRNTKWGMIQNIIMMLSSFLVRTVLIYKLGAEYAGLNSLFTSVLSILSLTELGFSNAIVYSMYKPIAENDNETLCALLNLYKKTYRIIGGVILGLGLMLLPVLKSLIQGDVPPDINLYLLYIAFLSNTVLSYFLFAYKSSLLYAHQRNDVVSRNTAIINLLSAATNIVVLLIFSNYYTYVVCILASTVIQNFVNSATVDRLYPEICCRGQISNEQKKDIKQRILGLVIWKIGGATRNTLDSIIISAFIGLTMVAIYNNYHYIMISITSVFGIFTSSLLAGVGNKIVTGSVEDNYKDFNKFNLLYMFIAGWATTCLLCLYQPFMKLWMGEKLMLPFFPMLLFCVYFFVLKMGDINSTYYQAAGLWYHGRYRSIIETALNLFLNLTLGYLWGVSGIISATIFSVLLVWPYATSIIFKHYFTNHKVSEFYICTLGYVLITAVCGFCTYGLCMIISSAFPGMPVVVELISRAFLCVASGLLMWLFFRKTRWYPDAKTFVFNALKKRI